MKAKQMTSLVKAYIYHVRKTDCYTKESFVSKIFVNLSTPSFTFSLHSNSFIHY